MDARGPRSLTVLPAAFALAWCSVACEPTGGPATTDETPSRYGGTLHVGTVIGDIRSLDPVLAIDISSSSVAGALFEGLVGYSPSEPGALTPRLATSWDASPDGRVFTFHLRAGVRFHDDPCFEDGKGRPVSADDVVYSLERSVAEGARAGALSLAGLIAGGESFVPGGAMEGLERIDAATVRITLRRPSNAFLHALAAAGAWIVPREAVERYGDNFGRHPVGTGPFRLASWSTSTVALVRNRHYWKTDDAGNALPYLDNILMEGAGGAGALADLLQGRRHVLYQTGAMPGPVERLRDLMAERGILVLEVPKLNTIFLGWNLARDGVWARDPELRRAVSLAIERPAPDSLLTPAAGLLPPGLPGCAAGPASARASPEEAARVLERAGFPGGRRLPPLELGTMETTTVLTDGCIEPLRALGLDAVLSVVPREIHWQALDRGDYEFFRDGWIADYPDPENFFHVFHSDSPANRTRYSNERYDRLFDRLSALPPQLPERARICRELEAILRRDAPAIFLYHEKSVYFVHPDVRGFEASINPFERKFYEYVWLDRGEP